MKSFPYFVHVNYLKYLGWGLSDSDSSVRCSALNSVKEVFLRWGAEEPLVLFHQRFVNRILEMTRDVDSSVVTASVDLITQLMK
jgi:cohesin complex subunit SA-1/2